MAIVAPEVTLEQARVVCHRPPGQACQLTNSHTSPEVCPINVSQTEF